MPNINIPKLKTRIEWILNCATVSSFDLVLFDDWKIKKFRVFIRVKTIREYKQVWDIPGVGTVFELAPEWVTQFFASGYYAWREVGFGTKTIRIVPDPEFPWNFELKEVPNYHCYYLGQYPWLWDNKVHQIAPPVGSWVSLEYTPKVSNLIMSLSPHFFVEPRYEPFYGPIVPKGWEASILGYLPMDSTSDIESQIEQLKQGIEADQVQAETEKGKDFKTWLIKSRHLTPEEILDIERTVYALKNRTEFEKLGSKTEGGMLVATWLKENLMFTESDMRFFWGDHAYLTYLLSREIKTLMDNRYKNCLAQNYPM